MPKKVDPAQQEAFKRELPAQIRQLQQAYPHVQVELWAMDEHRVGLKPVVRRVWAWKGHRPLIRVQQRYEWLYVYVRYHQCPLSQRGLARSDVPPPSK